MKDEENNNIEGVGQGRKEEGGGRRRRRGRPAVGSVGDGCSSSRSSRRKETGKP